MIQKNIEAIDISDVQALLDGGVRENRTTEYKAELPGKTDTEKIRFLAEVSAFANTDGGDMIFGIQEQGGIPSGFPGIDSDDLDADLLRLEDILRNGLEPRVQNVRLKAIEGDGRNAIIVRTPKSFEAPHRVSFKDHAKFYARSSAGKFPLDTWELRAAFLSGEELPERIRQFRSKRIAQLRGRDEVPVPLAEGGLLCLHIVPLASFSSRIELPIYEERNRRVDGVRPPGASGWNSRFNLDGVVNYSGGRGAPSSSYSQLYRNGLIECVENLEWGSNAKGISSLAYERDAIETVTSAFELYQKVGIDPPALIYLTFIGIWGYRFFVDQNKFIREEEVADRDDLLVPDIHVLDFDEPVEKILKPVFDMVWNAFGYLRSFNYDADGRWVGR
ncbi:putative transcriptional regulator with HTH domain [Thioflavicoccus mobilis 8321]|uniref:Putative transcriptional regulator with HTH domain n=1 Tax=Thioflavicoccus mobilis 8321 TaxID=765912 RepID=L0GWP9_9GAMM|nr:ATP-binding protein [Thioflavicoccus mobilis]AGA89729.1 putative transcriptional regulator with HTH domain [Thioflavicoccus mobilis 8321]